MIDRTFFQMAKAGKRVTAVWWAIPLAIVFMLVGQAVGGFIYVMLGAAGLVPGVDGSDISALVDIPNLGSAAQGMFLGISFFFAALFTLIWIWLFEKRSSASFGLGNIGAGLMKFGRGALLAVVVMAIMTYGLGALGMVETTAPSAPASWVMIWPLLLLMLGWSIQGSAEEIIARGLLFQSVGARNGLIVAVIASSAMFSLAHGLNENPSALFFVNLAAYSIFTCFYALREASLWGVCGYHAFWNFAQGNIFGFAVSGSYIGADRLMTSTSTGPDWITGGVAGLEGGVVTLAGLALSTAAILAIRPDAHAKAIAHHAEQPDTASQP